MRVKFQLRDELMVINDEFKFIFVHVPKNAGSSMTHLLKALPGDNSFLVAKTKHETLQEFSSRYERQFLEVNRETSVKVVDYFRFGFVRNPWSRMFSFYRYLKEARPRKEIDEISSFKDFLILSEAGEKWINGLHSMRSQLDFFVDASGLINIDFLGHFEYLLEDFALVSNSLVLPGGLSLPKKNVSSSSLENYVEYFDDEMISIVQRRFSREINFFGYEFKSPFPANRYSKAVRQR